jgi:hypothetical protein
LLKQAAESVSRAKSGALIKVDPLAALSVLRELMAGGLIAARRCRDKKPIMRDQWDSATVSRYGTAELIDGFGIDRQPIRKQYDIEVYASDVLTHFSGAQPPVTATEPRGPGRPSSWHLIEAEARRRWLAGERHPGTARTGENHAEWARVLRGWLKAKHPSCPRPSEKRIQNLLGDLIRELQRV